MHTKEQIGNFYFERWYIPQRMMESLVDYVKHRIPTGDFLQAILENNFVEAVARADDENLKNLPAYAAFLYNNVPRACWGSPEKVNAWIQGKS